MSVLASFGTAKAEIDVTFEADKISLERKDNVMVAQGNVKIAQKVTCWKQIKLPMTK